MLRCNFVAPKPNKKNIGKVNRESSNCFMIVFIIVVVIFYIFITIIEICRFIKDVEMQF